MKLLLLSTTMFLINIGCSTTSNPNNPPSIPPEHDDNAICTTHYEPHLCMIKIDDKPFSGYGTNECQARRKLSRVLQEAYHNPLLAKVAKCGKVFTSYGGPLLIRKSCNVLFEFSDNE